MIDHTYVLLIVNDFSEVDVLVYEHRVNAVYDAVAAAEATLGDNYRSVTVPEDVHQQGLDLMFKAKHGPACVSLHRRVPK